MSDDTPRVLVHGNPETRRVWDRLLPELDRQGIHDVVCLSPPGEPARAC